MLETQKRVNSGELSSDALLAYNSLQQKYSVYQRVVQSNINYYLKENPGAWLVYETGYKKLFGFTGTGDVQDTLLAGLLCVLCFSGLFAMERKGGMDEVLTCTPLGRKYTVKAKLWQKVPPWQRLYRSEPFCLTCGRCCVTMAFPLCWDLR